MKKKLTLLVLALCTQQTLPKKIVIGSAAFLTKVGRKLPQFGRVENKKADVFSTPFLFPIENSEIISPFLPEHIQSLIHKHPQANVDYWIRINTSVNKYENIQKEFEAIPMPWSILFHGWAYRNTPIMRHKTIEWGFYDPIPYKENLPKQNYLGYEEGIWASAKSWWNKNPIHRNTLHKEQVLIEHDGPIYKTALPLNEKRFFMNFWTYGYIHDAAVNRNHLVVIYELVIKEPSFKTRKNRKTQGVFYPDLTLNNESGSDFDKLFTRLTDYQSALKNKSFQPENPFTEDLNDALKKIASGSYVKEDSAALENFTNTIKNIYEMIKLNPLTQEDIKKLAETYAEEFHLSKSDYGISRSLRIAAPNATPKQMTRILELAKAIHESNLHNAASHALNLEKNPGYKEQQIEKFGGLYESIQEIYRPYAQKLASNSNVSDDSDNGLENKESFEAQLREALKEVSRVAHEAKTYNDFIEKCEKLAVSKKIQKDETYQTSIFKHVKHYIEENLENIYETIQYAIDNQTDKAKLSSLKKLLTELMDLSEKIRSIDSLKDEDYLIRLVNSELPKINDALLTIVNQSTLLGKKEIDIKSEKYETIINNLKKLETASSYEHFIDLFNKLRVPSDYTKDATYQNTYLMVVKKIIRNDINTIKNKKNNSSEVKSQIKDLENQLASTTYTTINDLYENLRALQFEVNSEE
jgi:hypothetical protein